MMEIPEAHVIAEQINQAMAGRRVKSVVAGHSPHRLVWYFGDPAGYDMLLAGRHVERARAAGGNVELEIEGARLLLQDGAAPRLLAEGGPVPARHQLRMEFDGGGRLCVTCAMYGGICAFLPGENKSPYYLAALERPPVLSAAFSEEYFASLFHCKNFQTISAKAFLATEQRIPGLGNGVLQDLLWNAGIHPRRRMGTLRDADFARLYGAVKSTIAEMMEGGGRDTERDLYGCAGGYRTKMSKRTAGGACPACGGVIGKGSYLGGSVYYCAACQPLME